MTGLGISYRRERFWVFPVNSLVTGFYRDYLDDFHKFNTDYHFKLNGPGVRMHWTNKTLFGPSFVKRGRTEARQDLC